MEIWFKNQLGQACLFLSDTILTGYIAQRIADNIKEEGWSDEVWTVEL